MGGSSFLKQENIQLQTHHVELLNFLLLFPLIFTTEPAGTLMLPARCVCVQEKERERGGGGGESKRESKNMYFLSI